MPRGQQQQQREGHVYGRTKHGSSGGHHARRLNVETGTSRVAPPRIHVGPENSQGDRGTEKLNERLHAFERVKAPATEQGHAQTKGAAVSNISSSSMFERMQDALNSTTSASVAQKVSQIPLDDASASTDGSMRSGVMPQSPAYLAEGGHTGSGYTSYPVSNLEQNTCSKTPPVVHKPGSNSLFPIGWGLKSKGLPMKMPTTTSPLAPSWMALVTSNKQMLSSAENDGTTEATSGELLEEFQRLIEAEGECRQRLEMEKQVEQERLAWDREREKITNEMERWKTEAQNEMEGRQRAEQRSRDLQTRLECQEHQLNEFRTTLASAQRALEENRRTQSRDWVIHRDEVRMSGKSLGVGGWGSVVEGRFRGTKVAVKQIHELILSPHNRRLFEREMNIASRCRHPCLLQFIGATNDDASPLFVTELMEKSLRALLQERSLGYQEILTISTDVALALNYLHLNRPTPIIHRDISSANVLLWRQGQTWRGKVSDYGTANFVHQTMTAAPGAPPYSAPEAVTSSQSPKVDVYSFGALLCEICTRELPVPDQREEQIAMVTNHVLRDLIRRCLERNPESRPTMQEILDELGTLSETCGVNRLQES